MVRICIVPYEKHLQTTTITQKNSFVFRRVENILGKGENAGYQYFSFFHRNVLGLDLTRMVGFV